jgi:hypothetical protein
LWATFAAVTFAALSSWRLRGRARPYIGREPAEARLERSGFLESRGDVQFHEVCNSARDASFSTA